MVIIDRYIFRAVVSNSLITLFAVVMLTAFFSLINELEDVGEGRYGLTQVFIYLALTVPRMMVEIMPLALLIGGLLGMGALASSNELVVMRAAGVSLQRLVSSALKAGLILGLIALLVAEFVAPYGERLGQELRAAAKHESLTARAGGGFWARDGHEFIKVDVVLSDQSLGGISIITLDQQLQLSSLLQAKTAHYSDNGWTLREVQRLNVVANRINNETLSELRWDSVIRPTTLTVLASEPKDLALRELSTYIEYLEDNALDARQYHLAYWTKLFVPLTNLALLIVAMPFAFGPARSAGVGQRLFIGIMLGLGFFLLTRMLSHLVLLSGLPPLVGAVLPSLLFAGGAVFALSRMR